MVASTMKPGQMKRIIEILTSSVPSDLSQERAELLINGELRPYLQNFWSAATRETEVYEVMPLYSFETLTRQYDGIAGNVLCKKVLRFPRPKAVKPVRLRVLTYADIGSSFDGSTFPELLEKFRTVDIEVATAPEMLGFLAQECINPSRILDETLMALGTPLKDPAHQDDTFLIASRKSKGTPTKEICCGLMPGDDRIEQWEFNFLVHA